MRDRAVAPYLAEAAEFSIRLLQWNDTNRASVLEVQRMIKHETYAQEWGANLDYRPLPLRGVIDLTSDAYLSLQSPRLVKIEIGENILVQRTPERVDLADSLTTPIPFVFRNRRGSEVDVSKEVVLAAGVFRYQRSASDFHRERQKTGGGDPLERN